MKRFSTPCLFTLGLLALGLPSCIIAPKATPRVGFSLGGVSQNNFRGVPFDEKGAIQSDMSVSFPTTRDNGELTFNVFGNMALSNDNAGGVLGGGNSREVTRSDYTLSYSEPVRDFDLVMGVTHYTFPGNRGFSMGQGYGGGYGGSYITEGTTQVFGSASWDKFDLQPTVEIFFDVDVAPGFYLNAHMLKIFDWREKTWFEVRSNLALAEGGYARVYYGKEKTSLADLGVSGAMKYELDDNTLVSATLNYSTLIDGTYRNRLADGGVDSSNVWLGFGAHWNW